MHHYIKMFVMAKKSKALFLPRKAKGELETMGMQIKLARKRRRISLAQMAERTQCSQLTVMRVEKGEPTVSIGIYARILFGLGLDEDLTLVAQKDPAGTVLINNKILKRNERNEDEYDVFD